MGSTAGNTITVTYQQTLAASPFSSTSNMDISVAHGSDSLTLSQHAFGESGRVPNAMTLDISGGTSTPTTDPTSAPSETPDPDGQGCDKYGTLFATSTSLGDFDIT